MFAKENKNGEIELNGTESEIGELCTFRDLLEYASEGNNLINGFIMCRDGIINVNNEEIELVVKSIHV